MAIMECNYSNGWLVGQRQSGHSHRGVKSLEQGGGGGPRASCNNRCRKFQSILLSFRQVFLVSSRCFLSPYGCWMDKWTCGQRLVVEWMPACLPACLDGLPDGYHVLWTTVGSSILVIFFMSLENRS